MDSRKRKTKAYYRKSAKISKANEKVLSPGFKGFICTCNNTEKQCVREAYNILNEVSDQLYGKEVPDNEETEDIETDLDAELSSIREKATMKKRRFQVIESGAKNLVFIKTEVESPKEVMAKILDSIRDSGEQKTRYLLRMLPVEVTCKAVIEDIKKNLEPLIEKHFSDARNFHILITARNSNIKRDHILPELLNLFKSKLPNLTGSLVQPHKSLVIEIVKSTACLCIAEDYDLNAKYNLLELALRNKKETKDEEKTSNDKLEDQQLIAETEKTSNDKLEDPQLIAEVEKTSNDKLEDQQLTAEVPSSVSEKDPVTTVADQPPPQPDTDSVRPPSPAVPKAPAEQQN